MKVEIREKMFNPWTEVQSYQEQLGIRGKFGATTMFVGTMRDTNEGEEIMSMRLEHYPEMTLRHLEQIAQDALNKYEILDILILHRVGQVLPNDPIVCVAVWSEHRGAAYNANRYIMEDLKYNAPFWKKETLNDKDQWVKKNTPG